MADTDDGIPNLPDFGESLDNATFEQILEMDEDENEREFSRSIVYGFFDQAEQTFDNMQEALKNKNLAELSGLGHFLKGSSATLGLNLVKNSCEKIQHWGHEKDETGTKDESVENCLKHIDMELHRLKSEYQSAKTKLKRFYGDNT